MDTIFTNPGNSKTSQPYRLLPNLSDKINLKINCKYVALSNHKKCHTKSAPMRNEKFDLPDGPYSVLNTQDYFNYIIKKHETVTDNPPAIIYVNKI